MRPAGLGVGGPGAGLPVPADAAAWAHIAGAVGLVLALEASAEFLESRRHVAFLYLVILAAVVRYAWPTLRRLPPRARGIMAAFAIASLGLVAGTAALTSGSVASAFADGLFPTLSGWMAALILVQGAGLGSDSPLAGGRCRWVPLPLPVLLALAAIVLTAAHLLAVGNWGIGDEVLYVVQARWLRPPELGWTLPPELAEFFYFRKTEYDNGQMYGMYPPGWPAILALFGALGLEWWSAVILGLINIGLASLLARRLFGPEAGLIAALLLATSQQFLIAHAGYMAHASAMAVALGAMLALLAGADTAGWRRAAWWIGAGILLGIQVTIRPLTGLALGTSLVAWMVLRSWHGRRGEIPVLLAMLTVGGLGPGLLLAWHNAIVYGDAFALGYSSISAEVYQLGFGERGITTLGENLERIRFTGPFTPANALASLLRRLTSLNTAYLPIGMVLPLVAVALTTGLKVRWGVVAVFGLLPAAHFFYWFGGLRLYVELLPFLLVGVAGVLVHLARSQERLTATWLMTLILASTVMALPWSRTGHNDDRRWSEHYRADPPSPISTLITADSLGRAHGRVLLFARDESRFENMLGSLYWFNGDRFDGPVLVARDRGERNAELIRQLPDRVPFLVLDRGRHTPAEFLPLR